MVDPISDDELQRVRERWNYLQMFDIDYRISERVGQMLRLLARLDAAESRVEELQREVERLSMNQRKPRLRELAERSGVKTAVPDVSEYDIQIESMKPFTQDLGIDPC